MRVGNPVFVLSAGLEFFYAVVSAILLIGCLLNRNRALDKPADDGHFVHPYRDERR